ncbi:MAG: hypothetical protein JST54_24230 [Deltaproteobacteria bacterium]|nr:hypothetical protein [Deltaproteobacteria bacterium]
MCAGVPYRGEEPARPTQPASRRPRWTGLRSHRSLLAIGAGLIAVTEALSLASQHIDPNVRLEAPTFAVYGDELLCDLVAVLVFALGSIGFATLLHRAAGALDQPRWLHVGQQSHASAELLRWLKLYRELGLGEVQVAELLVKGAHPSRRAELMAVRDAVLDDVPLGRALASSGLLDEPAALSLAKLAWTRTEVPFPSVQTIPFRRPTLLDALSGLPPRRQALTVAISLALPVLVGALLAHR